MTEHAPMTLQAPQLGGLSSGGVAACATQISHIVFFSVERSSRYEQITRYFASRAQSPSC